MKTGYRKLRAGSYLSPESNDRYDGGWVPMGSVVYIHPKQKPGRLAPVHEMYVTALFPMGERTGWISRYVSTTEPKRERLWNPGAPWREDDDIAAFDSIRASMDGTGAGLTPEQWASNFGHLHVRTLIRFCRELNHRIKPDDDPIRAGMSLFLNREVSIMKKTAKKTTKTAVAEKPVKKAKKESNGEGRTKTLDRSTGTLLLEALAKAPGRNKLIPLATRLANGEVLDKKALTTLRDGVNASAAEARASNKPKTAGLLANANRQVRRLWRRA